MRLIFFCILVIGQAWKFQPTVRLLTPYEEAAAGRILLAIATTPEEKKIAAKTREILVMHNLRLVSHITKGVMKTSKTTKKPYNPTLVPTFIELFSEGVIGLNQAADRYIGRGKFSKYAYHFIRSRILQTITTYRGIMSHNKAIFYNRTKKTRFLLAAKFGRKPTTREVADYLGVSEKSIRKVESEAARILQVISALPLEVQIAAAAVAKPHEN